MNFVNRPIDLVEAADNPIKGIKCKTRKHFSVEEQKAHPFTQTPRKLPRSLTHTLLTPQSTSKRQVLP
jgi:hypothetical protein